MNLNLANDWTAMILASGTLGNNGSVAHVVSVSAEASTWTVLRRYEDFHSLSENVCRSLPTMQPCPSQRFVLGRNTEQIVDVRNELNEWLKLILRDPCARESLNIHNFVKAGANIIQPEFENVSWIFFSTDYTSAAQSDQPECKQTSNKIDDLEMDDMFTDDDDDDDDDNASCVESDDDQGCERNILPKSQFPVTPINRKETQETITYEDELDLVADAEFVEDLVSLAQSMGASNLGRSLQLQAEMGKQNNDNGSLNYTVGVTLSKIAPRNKGENPGALAQVLKIAEMEERLVGIGDSFHQIMPISPPKLDSFQMVKVIGKGSFGK
jgi:PX domain